MSVSSLSPNLKAIIIAVFKEFEISYIFSPDVTGAKKPTAFSSHVINNVDHLFPLKSNFPTVAKTIIEMDLRIGCVRTPVFFPQLYRK